jgi:hypothetical protein
MELVSYENQYNIQSYKLCIKISIIYNSIVSVFAAGNQSINLCGASSIEP